jgi:hypothetical protein
MKPTKYFHLELTSTIYLNFKTRELKTSWGKHIVTTPPGNSTTASEFFPHSITQAVLRTSNEEKNTTFVS